MHSIFCFVLTTIIQSFSCAWGEANTNANTLFYELMYQSQNAQWITKTRCHYTSGWILACRLFFSIEDQNKIPLNHLVRLLNLFFYFFFLAQRFCWHYLFSYLALRFYSNLSNIQRLVLSCATSELINVYAIVNIICWIHFLINMVTCQQSISTRCSHLEAHRSPAPPLLFLAVYYKQVFQGSGNLTSCRIPVLIFENIKSID